MSDQIVTVTRDAGVATVTMNRPPVNAIAPDLLEQFDAAFTELGADAAVRVIVVTSAIPRYFMAGADIKLMAAARPQGGEDAVRNSPFSIVERTAKPVIAAINGHALGGGCELALCCDYRFMLDDGHSTIGLTETSLGIIPGAGGTQRLTRLVGPARAKDLVFTGRFVGAEEALRIGLADQVVPADRVYDEARAWAGRFRHAATYALRAAKECIDRGLEVDLDTGLELERVQFAALFATEDRTTGMTSFVEEGPGKARFAGR
jgi:enoyl-CoA hydratase/carnithine racemase